MNNSADKQSITLDALGIRRWVLRDGRNIDAQQDTAVVPQVASAPTPPSVGQVAETVVAEPPAGRGADNWEQLAARVASCTLCPLHEGRTQAVFGVGPTDADVMVIGEAPGAEEDRRGEPFVGPAGQLLDAMLAAIGLSRSDSVFIANIVKCRPPQNRDPRPEESAACRGYLERQIALLAPRVILAVGRVAAQNLLGSQEKVGRLRTGLHEHEGSGTPVLVTYHPAYLLRSPGEKAKAWGDLKRLRDLLGEVSS